MNFAKGGSLGKNGKRTGKGASFKKAMAYYLHDKRPEGAVGPHPESAERVGFVVMENLPPCSPSEAWREMKFLANAADHIKERNARAAAIEAGTDPDAAAQKARLGRKCTEPLYVYSLNWHKDDAPTDEEMLEAARQTLALLGLEGHQAMIVQHTDQSHAHVHIAVNRVNPDTGIANPMSNDEYKLDEWAFLYEIERGVVRSPDRYAKHIEAMQKKNPAKAAAIIALNLPGAPALGPAKEAAAKKERKPRNNQTRQEWSAKKRAGNDNASAKAEAEAIKQRFNEEYRKRRQREDEIKARHTAERNTAWLDYKAAKAKIWDAYKPQIDRHWQRPRRGQSGLARLRAYFNDPRTAWREDRERAEWRALGRRHWRERRDFEARERTMTGAITNAVRLSRVDGASVYRGRLAGVFHLTRDAAERRRLFDLQQEQQKKAVRDMQNARKKAMSDPIRAKRDAELKALAEDYDRRRKAIEAQQRGDWLAQKAERAAANQERNRAWDSWREKFKITDRPGYTKPDRKTADRPAVTEWTENREDVTRPAEPTTEAAPRRTFTAFSENKKDVTTPTQEKDFGRDRGNAGGRERTRPGPGPKFGPKGD